jgi:hypothetical protein
MLDEKALRREGFSEGPKVKLGDGQEWTFPEPRPIFFPRRDGDGKVSLDARRTYDADYLDRLDDLFAAEDGVRRLEIETELAVGLLLRNYDLDDQAIRRLFATVADDPAGRAMWDEIEGVILGLAGPKPSAVGSDPASGPTTSTPTA